MSEHSPARNDEWRQPQAELDAQAILQGMAQARQRAEQLARTGAERGSHTFGTDGPEH